MAKKLRLKDKHAWKPPTLFHCAKSAHHRSQRHVKSNKNHPNPWVGLMDRSPSGASCFSHNFYSPPLSHIHSPPLQDAESIQETRVWESCTKATLVLHKQTCSELHRVSKTSRSSWQGPGSWCQSVASRCARQLRLFEPWTCLCPVPLSKQSVVAFHADTGLKS